MELIFKETTYKIKHKRANKKLTKFSLDNAKHESEQFAKDLLVIFKFNTDVERLNPGQVFQQIEVTFECWIFRIFQTPKLFYQKQEQLLKIQTSHVTE